MEPDVLGPPYERQTIDLGTDDEGPVVATVVRRRAERPTGRAVLYVHGFVDYFFQTHLADFFAERGWDFYALDLRKYGRSLLPGQTPNFCHEISDYFPELDAAAEIIRKDDGHDTLLAMGHSTGGLIISLWADARRDTGTIDGLVLNSPFFDLNAPWAVRRPLAAAASRLGRRAPHRILPFGLGTVYGESIHSDHRGEWTYDLAWKPLAGFPVRAGWLNAIRTGQRRLRAGLDIQVPVLLACSTRSFRGTKWHDNATLADAVLDVEHMVRYAPRLGRHVTVARFDGGLHDLTLSGPAVRKKVFDEVGRWAEAFLAAGPTAPADAAPPDAAPPDAVPPDAAPPDAVPPDAVPPDAVPTDAAPTDAAPADAARSDAARPDASSADAARTDADRADAPPTSTQTADAAGAATLGG